MVENRAEAVAAEIERMAARSALDDETVAAGIKIFIADRVLAAAESGQVSAEAIIDQLSCSLRHLADIRRGMTNKSNYVDFSV